MCCRTWVNNPKSAAAQVELLTRDADAPCEASGESIAPPPPSKLVEGTLLAKDGAAADSGSASGTSANGVSKVANGLAGLMLGNGMRAGSRAAPLASRTAA